ALPARDERRGTREAAHALRDPRFGRGACREHGRVVARRPRTRQPGRAEPRGSVGPGLEPRLADLAAHAAAVPRRAAAGGVTAGGLQKTETEFGGERRREFVRSMLRDLKALEHMLASGAIEEGVSRIGAEQEMFLIDGSGHPVAAALTALEAAKSPHF